MSSESSPTYLSPCTWENSSRPRSTALQDETSLEQKIHRLAILRQASLAQCEQFVSQLEDLMVHMDSQPQARRTVTDSSPNLRGMDSIVVHTSHVDRSRSAYDGRSHTPGVAPIFGPARSRTAVRGDSRAPRMLCHERSRSKSDAATHMSTPKEKGVQCGVHETWKEDLSYYQSPEPVKRLQRTTSEYTNACRTDRRGKGKSRLCSENAEKGRIAVRVPEKESRRKRSMSDPSSVQAVGDSASWLQACASEVAGCRQLRY